MVQDELEEDTSLNKDYQDDNTSTKGNARHRFRGKGILTQCLVRVVQQNCSATRRDMNDIVRFVYFVRSSVPTLPLGLITRLEDDTEYRLSPFSQYSPHCTEIKVRFLSVYRIKPLGRTRACEKGGRSRQLPIQNSLSVVRSGTIPSCCNGKNHAYASGLLIGCDY